MKIYGLLGKDIDYSLSPLMHNAAFRALGIDAEYRIFDTGEGALGDFFSGFRKGTVGGCNVTIPYKEKALEFVDTCDGLAGDIKAINTVSLNEGKLCGHNTDLYGFIQALKESAEGDLNFDPKEKSIFVFGAGGAAKAVIYGLMHSGAKRIVLTDVDAEKAERLAQGVSGEQALNFLISVVKDRSQFEEFISKSDLLINATPSGMKISDPELFDYRYIHEKLSVFDLVYARETPLLREAKKRGAKAAGGMNMLLYQAGRSFTIWTGIRAPFAVMKKAVSKEIER